MLGKLIINLNSSYNWRLSKPTLRYTIGTCIIMTITIIMDYPLSYLTSILALNFMSPGTQPLSLKNGLGFILILTILTGISYYFSQTFVNYPLIFMPLLSLGILWIYYSQKFPTVIKLFALMSFIIIPLLSLESVAIGGILAISLVFNTLMAISLTQIMFVVFPWSKEDQTFAKTKETTIIKSEMEQFNYAKNIMIVLLPLLLLFFVFKLSGGLLILIFVAILSISPALSNVKTGAVMIIANILGGIAAILVYNLLVIVPLFPFMILLTLIVGLLFANNLFSSKKIAPIFGTGFSTFLLILSSVTSSDSEAGEALWSRVFQISIAVIYVVTAFGLIHLFKQLKLDKKNI